MTGAGFVPSTADAGIRWPAAMGLMLSLFAAGAAILYRLAPSFWVTRELRRSKRR